MRTKSITHLLAYYETVLVSINTPDCSIKICVSSENPAAPSPRLFRKSGRYELFVHISPASRNEHERFRGARRTLTLFPWIKREHHCLYFGSDTVFDDQSKIVETLTLPR
jgi:hypothetical protein